MLRDKGEMLGLRPLEIEDAISHIRFTDLASPVDSIKPRGRSHAVIGRILGSVDISAQMADRTYLEKLPFLFDEFKESGIDLFKDATDLLLRTPEFHKFIQVRLKNDLWDVHQHMKAHFKHRLGVEEDFYQSTVKRSMAFLADVCTRDGNPWSFLKRGDIVGVLGKGGIQVA
jgi:hypothetical protein